MNILLQDEDIYYLIIRLMMFLER